MKYRAYGSIFACFLFVLPIAAYAAEATGPVVNLMITADMPPSATEEQEKAAEASLFEMYKEIDERGLNATIFSTQDFIDSHARLRLTDIGLSSNFELAMSGNNSGERLSRMSLNEQISVLKRSKEYVEACRVCGTNEIKAYGFMPQSFDQNAETYKALDGLGIEYNVGFQAGIKYAPEHEENVWPYRMPGHSFYAVPVSSVELSGERVPLADGVAAEMGLDSSQWYDLLKTKLDGAAQGDEPVVVSLSTSVSGTGDYLAALGKFLDYAISKDAKFVTTMDLVNISRLGDSRELPLDRLRLALM